MVSPATTQVGYRTSEQADGTEIAGGLSRTELLILIALCATSVAACFFDLGSRSLWNDEFRSALIAVHHGTGLWSAVTADGGSMAVYYLLLHVFVALFGSGQFALRVPSALAGVALTPVMFFLGRRMFGTRTAVIGTAIVVASPALVVWAQQVRGYCLGTLLVAWSALALLRAIERPTRRRWFVYGLLCVLSIYTVVYAGLFLVAQCLPLVFGRKARARMRPVLAVGCVVAVAYMALIALLVRSGSGSVLLVNAPPSTTGGIRIIEELASGVAPELFGTTLVDGVVTVIGVLCWIMASAELVSRIRRGPGEFETLCLGIVLSWLLLPLLIDPVFSIAYRSIFEPSFLVQSVPAGAMVVAFVFVKVLPGHLSHAFAIGLVALLVAALVPTYGVSYEQWSQASRYIATASRSGDCLTVNKLELDSSLGYYFSLEGVGSAAPTLVLPRFTWSDALDPRFGGAVSSGSFTRVASRSTRLWIVLSRVSPWPIPAHQQRGELVL